MKRGKPFEVGNNAAKSRGPNKITKTVKETFLNVFLDLQEHSTHNLKTFAVKYPREFYNMATKLIPTEVTATVDATIIWQEQKTYEAKPKTD